MVTLNFEGEKHELTTKDGEGSEPDSQNCSIADSIKCEAFTFLGNDGRPYRLIPTQGQAWIYWLHPDNKWVTHSRIAWDQVKLINKNLTEKEQSCYPQ